MAIKSILICDLCGEQSDIKEMQDTFCIRGYELCPSCEQKYKALKDKHEKEVAEFFQS